jgi:hypothetical protein
MVTRGLSNGSENDPGPTDEPVWNDDVPPLTAPGRPYDLDESHPHGAPSYARRGRADVAAQDRQPRGHVRLPAYFEEDFEEAEEAPPEPAKRPWRALITLYFLMALLGSAGGTIWYYYGPDPAAPASASVREVERLAASLAQVEQEQRRLTETIRALQSGHDQLQRALAGREQEIQRLMSEANALRGALDAMHNAPAPAARSAHGAGRSPPASAAKKKAD